MERLFAEVAEMAGAVIVCRSSPRQKAAVVRVVKAFRRAQRRISPAGVGWMHRTSVWLNSGNKGKILAIGTAAHTGKPVSPFSA